jgi:hypothetical protein
MKATMNDKPRALPPTGPFFYGTLPQRRCIERWQDAGWTFLHWTEVPEILAVLRSPLDEIIFIDDHGYARSGPSFTRSTFVSYEGHLPEESDREPGP